MQAASEGIGTARRDFGEHVQRFLDRVKGNHEKRSDIVNKNAVLSAEH